jgi:manganese transport protein
LTTDPYIISEQTIKEPPRSFMASLKFLGPGFILSASIVGSGELIATTVLGASAGFAALWIIIISCLAKVAVQLEFGRHAILTGETAGQSFNKLPGLRIGKAKWLVWMLLSLQALKVVQIGGIIGSASVVMHLLFPTVNIVVWVLIIATFAAALIYNGKYAMIEKVSLLMILLFTVLTMASLFSIQFTEFAFSFSDILNGQRFKLSPEQIGIALGAFGITGVASDEIIAYNYWCIEKGYASYAGPPARTSEWRSRAQGWINVMYIDAVVAMAIYTLVTVTFYLLGAAILYGRETVPQGNQVIETLALIYTQSLGSGIKTIYLVGAFFVLFSSVYATLAYWTRVFTDLSGQIGWLDFSDYMKRKKVISLLGIIFPFVWASMFLFIQLPVLMVLSGGIVGSVMLILVIYAAWNFKYRRNQELKTSSIYNFLFWVSLLSITWVGVYGLIQVFR